MLIYPTNGNLVAIVYLKMILFLIFIKYQFRSFSIFHYQNQQNAGFGSFTFTL